MGNLCMTDNDYNDITRESYCYKCNDTFIVDTGGYSQRRSCRYHDFKDGYCINCRCTEKKAPYTCYHIKKHYWWKLC